MKISPHAAHAIRNGIVEAKLDLGTGGGSHEHEPALLAATSMMFGGVMMYNPLEERAYLHTLDRIGSQAHLGTSTAIEAT